MPIFSKEKVDIALQRCVKSLHLSKMWVWREAGSSEQKLEYLQLEPLNFLLCPGGANQAFLAQQPPFFSFPGYLQLGSYWDRENPANYKKTLGFHYLLLLVQCVHELSREQGNTL